MRQVRVADVTAVYGWRVDAGVRAAAEQAFDAIRFHAVRCARENSEDSERR